MINYTFIIEIRANIMAKVKYCKFKIWYFFTNLISILTFGLFLYYLIENNQLPISYSGDLFLVIIVIFIASVTNILIGPVTAWGSLLLQEKSLLNIALIKLILFTIFMAMCFVFKFNIFWVLTAYYVSLLAPNLIYTDLVRRETGYELTILRDLFLVKKTLTLK